MHPSPDVLALLALGEQTGTPEERAHIQSCTECQAEISDLTRAVTAGRSVRTGDSGLVNPPDRVWHAIRAELGFPDEPEGESPTGSGELPDIATVTALPRHAKAESNGVAADETDVDGAPPVAARADRPEPDRTATVTDLADAPTRSSRGRRGLALLVAAAVALVLGVGLGLGLDRILGPRQTVLWTAELQALPAFSGSTGEASVVEDEDGNLTLVIELNSPEPVDGSREVWLIDSGVTKMRALGYLTGAGGSWAVPADIDPRQFPVVDVSKEPPGDSDPAHSKVSIVRGTLNV